MAERNHITALGRKHMPGFASECAYTESVCVNVLTRMCKEVWGGHPGCIVVRERARAHHDLSSLCCRHCVIALLQGRKVRACCCCCREGEGEGASLFSHCREGEGMLLSG